MKKSIYLGLAAVQLSSVILGALQIWPSPATRSLLALYRGVSGTFTSFNFYAPNITPQLRARFTVQEPAQPPRVLEFEDGLTREEAIRTRNLLALVLKVKDAPGAERSLVASWAAAMFTRYPMATQITAAMDFIDVAPLGKSSLPAPLVTHRTYYEATYTLAKGTPAAG